MLIKDTRTGYGLATRALHWGMALAIVAMFALGVWMRTLDYYSPYYTFAPYIHRSVGMLLLMLLAVRLGWRFINVRPDDSDLSRLEAAAAHVVHWGFYPLLFALFISGYFISTADGRAVDVFGLFSVPSVYAREGLADTAGYVHKVLAYVTIALAAVHTAAALKHHFADHGRTLVRMWRGPQDS